MGKGICFLALVMLLFLLSPGIAGAEGNTGISYIIVHALNPEGVEIASIEGMNSYDVRIYDGDTPIGYGISNEEGCNNPIAISPGDHTIKVEFNGMTAEKNIVITPGIKEIIFVFTRTDFDLVSSIENCDISVSVTDSWQGPCYAGYDTPGCYVYKRRTCPIDPGDFYKNSHWDPLVVRVAFLEGPCSRHGTYDLAAKMSFHISENNVVWHEKVHADVDFYQPSPSGYCQSGTPEFFSGPHWGARAIASFASSNIYNILVPFPSLNFDYWYIQHQDSSTKTSIKIGKSPTKSPTTRDAIELLSGSYGINRFIPGEYYLGISFGNLYARAIPEYPGGYVGQIHYQDTREETGGGSFTINTASIPYDMTGTGIICEGVEPPVKPPIASFTYSPENPFINQEITFDASSSYDPDGIITNYHWDFGDGGTEEGIQVTHAYSEAGDYTVTLTVIDNDGLYNSLSEIVAITEDLEPPIASFTYSPDNPLVGEKITFDASSSYDSDGTIVSYEWDFGDGNTAEGVEATHIYNKSGNYTVTLTVTDNDGLKDSASKTVEVEPANMTLRGKVTVPENGVHRVLKDVRVTLHLDNGSFVNYTDDEGNYVFRDIPMLDFDLTVKLEDRDGTIEVYDSEVSNYLVFSLETETITPDKQDLELDIIFHESYGNLFPGTGNIQREHLDDNGIIYYYTRIARDFAEKALNLLLDHMPPVEVYIYGSDGTYYMPSSSAIVIDDVDSDINSSNKPDNREWHEFSHHIQADSLIGEDNSLPPRHGNASLCDPSNPQYPNRHAVDPDLDCNHDGYPNHCTLIHGWRASLNLYP